MIPLRLLALCAALPAWADAAAPAAIPFRTGPESGELLLRSLGGLTVAALVALGVALLIRRFAPQWLEGFAKRPGKKRRLETVERLRISPATQVVVVRWDDEEWLIAEGSQGTQLLGKRPLREAAGEERQDG